MTWTVAAESTTSPGEAVMLRGFATTTCYAADLKAAEAWYSEVLGIPAYFHVPGYVEFRVGDYQHELGIIDAQYAPPLPPEPAGQFVSWHVDDLEGTVERLLALGATEYQEITDRGDGFHTAAVVDPFGNILGVMQNPHYLDVLESTGLAADD